VPTRKDLQELARVRLREAQVLLSAGMWDGAYYLAGYAAECGLKACIAKNVRRYDFPDKDLANASFTHNLEVLVNTARLTAELRAATRADPTFEVNWGVAKDWKETSRYERRTQRQAEELVSAVADPQHGVLRWIRRYW
jgi:HEPN domain-containing protein